MIDTDFYSLVKKLGEDLGAGYYIRAEERWRARAYETNETLNGYIKQCLRWYSKSITCGGEVFGHPFVTWYRAKSSADKMAVSVSVVDLGERRLLLGDYIGRDVRGVKNFWALC